MYISAQETLQSKGFKFCLYSFLDSDADVSDIDEGPLNTFTVIFVTSDKDSGRGSPDTDTVCTPPPDILQTTNLPNTD